MFELHTFHCQSALKAPMQFTKDSFASYHPVNICFLGYDVAHSLVYAVALVMQFAAAVVFCPPQTLWPSSVLQTISSNLPYSW